MRNIICANPLNIINIKSLTHFSAAKCDFFNSGHLQQVAIVCPNLHQLNLRRNKGCLKNLQGLRAIATGCQKLEGLNILEISANEVENFVQLWEILVCLQLTYLCIDWCCLICIDGDDQTKHTIIGLHQKCLKMKALESHNINNCTECYKNRQPLMLSNFPLLLHFHTKFIYNISICERLMYLWYICDNIWWPWSVTLCNLQEVYFQTYRLPLSDDFMKKISAHGGLVHVILNVYRVTLNGIATLIENSPNLITYHVYTQFETKCLVLHNLKDILSMLEKKFSKRKLFLCGSFRLVNGRLPNSELNHFLVHGNANFVSLWA